MTHSICGIIVLGINERGNYMSDKPDNKMIKPRDGVLERSYEPKPPKVELPKNPPTDGILFPKKPAVKESK